MIEIADCYFVQQTLFSILVPSSSVEVSRTSGHVSRGAGGTTVLVQRRGQRNQTGAFIAHAEKLYMSPIPAAGVNEV